jgi:formylmethanofuran dehydrogenase subunit E
MKDSPLLQAGGRFHGHIGPFLAVGLRMGLAANEHLGRDPMGMKAVVKVEGRPPRSCVLDGIQYSTGCTAGKSNLVIEPDSKEISAVFTGKAGRFSIALRRGFLESIENDLKGAEEKAVVDYAFRIMDTPFEDIFEVIE